MGISKETDGRCLITLSRDCLYSRTLSFLSWLRYTSYPPRASPPGGVTGRPALSCSKLSFSFCYQDKVRLNKANLCYKAPYPKAWMDDTQQTKPHSATARMSHDHHMTLPLMGYPTCDHLRWILNPVACDHPSEMVS